MKRILVSVSALLIVVTWVLVVPACTSTSRAEIETRLLALEKNRPARSAGLKQVSARVPILGRDVEAQFTFLHAGASAPDRPVIVLVHGTPSSPFTWTEVVYGQAGFPGLAADCDVYALAVAGHAMTRTELDTYSFQACADWIGAFLATLNLRNVTLVGNSYGGEFVWRCALDHPDRVGRVVLMSSSGFPRRDDEWFPEEQKMRDWGPLARIGYWFNSRERILPALQPHFQAPVTNEHLEEVYLVCDNGDNWNAMVDLARDENGTRAGEIAKLRQPTLLLWGEKDIAYPIERFARLFERTIPSSRLVIVPRAGHYPQEEEPAFVAEALRAFARGAP